MGNSATQETKNDVLENNSSVHVNKVTNQLLETDTRSNDAFDQAALIPPSSFPLCEFTMNVDRLRKMNVFILDYTIRKSSLGYSRGHTAGDKKRIWNSIKDVGIDNFAIAELRDSHSVEDEIAAHINLMSSQTKKQSNYCISKLYFEVDNGIPSFITPPAISKMSKYGFSHIILDFSVCDPFIDWRIFSFQDFLDLLTLRLEQIRSISQNGRILFCCRDAFDLYLSVQNQSKILSFIAQVSRYFASRFGIFALMVEDATGTLLPWEISNIIRTFRATMDSNGWTNGHLLINAGKGYGMAEMNVLAALSEGATGIWCGICENGGIAGHASSTSIITNLYRLGNRFICSKFQIEKLCHAAAKVSKIITASQVSLCQEVYGPRCSAIFNATNLSLTSSNTTEKNLNFRFDDALEDETDYFNDPLLSMVPEDSELLEQLELTFGRRDYDLKIVSNMRRILLQDTKNKRKCDYYSSIGLFFLYEKAGGDEYLQDMVELVIMDESFLEFDKHPLLLQLYDYFASFSDCHDLGEGDVRAGSNYSSDDDSDVAVSGIHAINPMVYKNHKKKDLHMSYYAFFDGFVANFIAHVATRQFKELVEVLDYANSNFIAWEQIRLRARWALAEYPLERDTWKLEEFIHIIVSAFLLPELARKPRLHLFAQKISLLNSQIHNEPPCDNYLTQFQTSPDESLDMGCLYGIESNEEVSVMDLNGIERDSYDLNLPSASNNHNDFEGKEKNIETLDFSQRKKGSIIIFANEVAQEQEQSIPETSMQIFIALRSRTDSSDHERVTSELTASLKKKMDAFNLSTRSGENILLRRRSSVRAMKNAVPVGTVTVHN